MGVARLVRVVEGCEDASERGRASSGSEGGTGCEDCIAVNVVERCEDDKPL